MPGYTIKITDAEPITGVASRLLEFRCLLSYGELLDLDAAGSPAGMTLRLDTIDTMVQDPDAAGALLHVAIAFMVAATGAKDLYEHQVHTPAWAQLDEPEEEPESESPELSEEAPATPLARFQSLSTSSKLTV